ncbi:MAG: hypothetical protein PHQ00_06070, partial [Phycisphaerae bacterium]|nr:hypothetical protein [Phycisphaerae bacterium]
MGKHNFISFYLVAVVFSLAFAGFAGCGDDSEKAKDDDDNDIVTDDDDDNDVTDDDDNDTTDDDDTVDDDDVTDDDDTVDDDDITDDDDDTVDDDDDTVEGVVVFVFDQTQSAIYRLEDLNGNGDMNDAGEATVFYNLLTPPETGIDNSQGLYALGPNEILATDNFEPANIVRLNDLNSDGDAMDEGEVEIYFDGSLPGGYVLDNPVSITKGPGNAFYFGANNTLSDEVLTPEAFYRLKDNKDKNNTIEPDEIRTFYEFRPMEDIYASTIFDLAFDDSSNAYAFDLRGGTHISRIDPMGNELNIFADSGLLEPQTGFCFPDFGSTKLDAIKESGEIVAAVEECLTIDYAPFFIGLKDKDGSKTINKADEIRIIYDGETNQPGGLSGTPQDFFLGFDNSLIWIESGNARVLRLSGVDGTAAPAVLYDPQVAELAMERPLSVAVWIDGGGGDDDDD